MTILWPRWVAIARYIRQATRSHRLSTELSLFLEFPNHEPILSLTSSNFGPFRRGLWEGLVLILDPCSALE